MAFQIATEARFSLCLLTILVLFIHFSQSIKCPGPQTALICKDTAKLKIAVQFELKKGKCVKFTQKIAIKIKCPKMKSRVTKCKNGVARKIFIKYMIKKCECLHKRIVEKIKCPCPKSKTIRSPCIKGNQKVVTIFHVRFGEACMPKKKIHEEICDKSSGWKPKYACQCYHYGRGNILTFDRRRLIASSAGKCTMLLSQWINKKSECSYKLFVVTKNGKYVGQLIHFKNNKYLLSDKKELYINGKRAPVPYSGKRVRVFYSGEYLQFVVPKCSISIAYNGHGGGYLNVGVYKGHKFVGLCGNCNGNPIDDKLDKSLTGGRKCQPVSGKGSLRTCLKKHSKKIGSTFCGRLAGMIPSKFLKCRSMSFHFFRGCVKDVCSEWPNKNKMYVASCKVHSLAAEACSERQIFLKWRTPKFCPLKCSINKRFVGDMNPCPKTCENHFFGTSRRCFKLPHRNGCECKSGYVLDGNRCVVPTQCQCLDKVCVDRFSKNKCTKWMTEGRCTKFPEVMKEFCRLTCKFCTVNCEDQISTNVCLNIKLKGKCKLDFYKQMCRLTCFPESCKCPACEVKISECHPVYKYQIKKTICYKLNYKGQCMPLVTREYNICGTCSTTVGHSRTKCDFCKGYRWSISISHFRDESIKKKCKSISSRVKEPCQCRIEQGSQIKCLSDTKMVKIAYKYGTFKCIKCVKHTSTKILKRTDCRGTWMTKSPCNKHTGKRHVTFHKSVALNCKCNYSSRKVEVLCKCPKFRKKGPICENNAWVHYQVGYRMESKKTCKKTVTKSSKTVFCAKKTKILIRCNHKTCKRTKYIEKWKSEQCQCRLSVKKEAGGKCCCPKSKISQTPCLGYYILKKKVSHLLVNHECVTRIYQQKLRCRCPKKKVFKFCNKRKGEIVKGITTYHLTKLHTCRKKTIKSNSPVLCRKVNMREISPCLFSRRHTKLKFRKIIFKTLIQHNCKCVEQIRTFLEPCGCKDLKHKESFPCPKKCIGRTHCPRNCYKITKWYKYKYSVKRGSKRCIRSLLKIQKSKCCCNLSLRKKQSCIKGNYFLEKISKKVLVQNKCLVDHKDIRHKVQCKIGFIKRILGPKLKNKKFVIKNVFGFISKCKCKTKIKKRMCLWKCPPKIVKRSCNKVLKSIVIKINYFVLRGCKCVRREKIEKRKIFCPKYTKKIKSNCPKGSKEGVNVYKKAFQDGCKCKSKMIYKKKICKCQRGWFTKPKCKGKYYVKSKILFKIKGKKCKKSRKILKTPVHCHKKVKIIPKCYGDSGIFIKYKVFSTIKKCKCVNKKKVIKRGHCHCKHKKNTKSVKCDHSINKWIHRKVAYVLNSRTKKCQKKIFIKKRSVYCHPNKSKRSKCNLVNNRRKILKIYYIKKACQCIKRKKTIIKKCGCPKTKPKSKTVCDKKSGNIVTTMHYKKWKEEANKCIKVLKKRMKPIYCNRQVRIYKSKCNGKYFSEKIVTKFKDIKNCSCERKIRHFKRSCHCPTKIIITKCKKSNDFLGRKVLVFKTWEPKTKKCLISNRKVYYRRCKCPKSIFRKFCIKGKIVSKVTVFKLQKHRCIKVLKSKKYEIFCPKSSKKIVGKCDKKKCIKVLTVFSRVNDKKMCSCVWRKTASKKCKCCGCPKKTKSTKCFKNKHYKTKILYFIAKEGKCSFKCKPQQKVIINKFKCHIELPKPRWTKCNKTKCQKRLIIWKLLKKNCKCIKRKYFGPSKTCCCKHKPKHRKFCKNGNIVSVVKEMKLENLKCKPWYKKNKKEIKCKHSFKKIVKKCNKKTCTQSVMGEKVVVNSNKCKCMKKYVLLYKQPCCCQKKSYKRKYCTGKCNVVKRVKYAFNKSTKSCIEKIKISKKCIKCPIKQGISSRCNKKLCLKFRYHTQYYVKKCRCIKHVSKTGHICCCPPKTPWSKTCQINQFVYKQRYYRLDDGKCVLNFRIRKQTIKCLKKRNQIKIFKCNKMTCLKKVRIFSQRQHGCKCIITKKDHYKKCCCPASTHKKICKANKYVTKMSKQWQIKSNKCVANNRMNIVQTIDQCKNRKWIGKCDKKTKTRTILFTIYKPRHCKCIPVKKILKHLLCACPKPVKRVSKCDSKSCKRTGTFIYFVGPIKNRKCIRKIRKDSWKCCCLGKKIWSKQRCNKDTGNSEIIIFRTIFDKKSRSCMINSQKRVIKTKCPKKIKTKIGKCQKNNGQQLSYSLGWRKDHSRCRCLKHTIVNKKTCSCNHRKCQIFKPKCVHDVYLQRKKICFIKKESKCSPQVSIHREKIECSKKKKHIRKCSEKSCKGKLITKWFVKKSCKCVPVMSTKEFTCCCPQSKKVIKCKNDIYEIINTKYRFDKHGKSCKKIIIKKLKSIYCKTKRIKITKCNRKNCLKSKFIYHYKVVHCKCKLIKTKRSDKKCCCPKKKSELKCHKKYGVVQHVLFNHRLAKGSCIVQKLVEQDKISCSPTKFIRSKCDLRTKKRTIKIISSKRIGCKCTKTIRTMKTLCACKKPRIIKGKCKKGRQSVYQVEYRLKKHDKLNKCVKAVIKLYSDPCKCKPKKVIKKCKYNQIQIRTIEYTLKQSKHRKYCHMEDKIKFQNIKCPKRRQIKTKCHKSMFKIITIYYRLKHCKCVKQKTVKMQACQCQKRNKHFRYCNDGVIFTVIERYYSAKGVKHCLMHTVDRSRSIKCPLNKKTIPITNNCNIKKNYSYFKEYLITWTKLVGCKCVKMSKKISKLCKCVKDMKKVRCIADDTLKIYHMTITRSGKHCLPKQEITTQDIQCTGKERDIRKYACNVHGKDKCFQKIEIIEKWVENCKCHKKAVIVKRRCCVPKPKRIKYCDAIKGQIVTKTNIYKLTLGNILYGKDDFLIQDKKIIKSVVYQRQETICPPKKIIERCHEKTGKWLRKIISYKRIGCGCKIFVKNIRGKCKCPNNKDIISKCKTEFKTIRSINYKLIGRHCVRFSFIKRQRCSCPKPISRIYCDGEGRWVKCMTEFTFNKLSKTCNLEKRCIRWDQVCPEPHSIEGKCNKHTFKRRIHEISYVTNEEKCTCEKSVEFTHEFCSCAHLNRVHTKCLDGLTLTKKIIYSLSKGQCVPTRIQIKKKTHCPSSRKHIMKCNRSKHSKLAGYRFIKKVVFLNNKCRCEKQIHSLQVPCDCKLLHKPIKNTFCKNGDSVMTQILYWVLIKNKCIKKVKYFKNDIVCSEKAKIKVGKCTKSLKSMIWYKRITIYKQIIKDCKCVWRVKKQIEIVCKCPPKIKTKQCLKDKIIERKMKFFRKDKHSKKCISYQKLNQTKIQCPKTWKSQKCKKSTCTLYITYYSQIASKCKCKTIRNVKKVKCCCPKPTKRITICDKKNGIFLTSWYTFKLVNKQCLRKRRRTSIRVRCERIQPKVRIGKCVKHYRTIYIINQKNHGCQCINVVKKYRNKCGCPKNIKFHKGKCIGKYATDMWSALHFIKDSKKCDRKIIQKRLRRCTCPKKNATIKCVNNQLLVQSHTSFVLKVHSNSCQKIVSAFKREIGCTIKPKLIKIWQSKCSKNTGYYQTVKKIYETAKECKCLKFQRIKIFPCNCKKLHQAISQKRCTKDKYIIRLLKISYLKNKKCSWKVLKTIKEIKCHGIKRKVGKCDRKTKHKTIHIYKMKLMNCKCKWRLYKTKKILCICPKPIMKINCVKEKMFVKIISKFYLRKNKCILRHDQVNTPVRCKVGTKVKITKCDSFSGFKFIKMTTKALKNCHCSVHSSLKKCRCKCPKPTKHSICERRTGNIKTTKVTSQLKKCKCISKRHVTIHKITCPKTVIRVTACKSKSPKKDKFKTIIKYIYHRDGCKCLKTIKKKHILCACNPMVQKSRKCVKDHQKVMIVTKRIKINEKCKRMEVDDSSITIACPVNKIKKICDKKSGNEKSFFLIWVKHKCKCLSKTFIKKKKCKCNSQLKFVRSIKCNEKCHSVKVFKYEVLKNKRCEYKYVAKKTMCCCPKWIKKTSKCLSDIGMVKITTKSLKFHNHKCVERITSRKQIIHCQKKKSKRSIKLPKGIIKEIISEHRLIDCKCKLLKFVKYERWSCPKNRLTKKCINVPESSIETVAISFRMMLKTTGCKKLVVINRVPTECPPDRTYWTKCKSGKHGYYKMLIQISYLAKNCKCKKLTEKTPTLCKCDRPKVKRICEKSKGLRIQILTTFVPDPHNHKHCVAIHSKQEFKVICRTQFHFNHRTKCSKHTYISYIISKAEKREGCECKNIWHSKPCKCRCPKTLVTKRCRIDNVREKIITSYVLVKCSCKKLVSSHLITIKCPMKTHSYQKCGGQKSKCISKMITTSYKPHKCKCKQYKKVTLKKCCCPKSRKQTMCIKGSWIMLFVSYKLTNNRCYKHSHHTSKKTHCSSERIVQMVGPCLGKKQKYILTTFTRKDCTCVKKKKFIFRNCLCLKKSAAEIVFLVDQAVSSRYKGFQKMIQDLLSRTISMFPIGKHSYQFALIKYSEKPSIVFNLKDNHKHETIFKYIKNIPYAGQKSNLANALHLVRTKILKLSRPGVLQLIYILSDGVNDNTGPSAYKEIIQLRKLHVKINAVAIKPSNNGLAFLKRLLRSHNSYFWEVHNKKHVQDLPYKMLRTICKKACPIGNIKRSKCSKDTNCQGRTYVYGYKTVGKQCLRTVTKRYWQCCCSKKPKTYVLCQKNRKLLVKISWIFINKACEKSTKKRDISSKIIEGCQPKIQRHSGSCQKSNYRTIVTIMKKIKNCKCIKIIRKKTVLCRCSRSKRLQVCKKHQNLVNIQMYQTLTMNKCIKRRSMSRLPIICPKSRVEISKCDKITCEKKIQIIKFKVTKCKCHHQLKTIKEKCCCPRNRNTNKTCKKNKILFQKTWTTFNKKLKTCVIKSVRRSIIPKCSKKINIKFGKCNIPFGKVWYKIKQVKWNIMKNCKCIKMMKTSKIPCKCIKGRIFKMCDVGGTWKKFAITYKLITMLRDKQIIGKCKKVLKLIWKKKHECQSQTKIKYSKCKKMKSTEDKYRILTISKMIRKGCRCVRTSKQLKELCKCQKGVIVNKCIKNKYKVSFHTWFTVLGRGKKAKCILKTKKQMTKTECPKPSIYKSKCSSISPKHYVIKTILYIPRNCKCIAKVYVRNIKCDPQSQGHSYNNACVDLMSRRACEKLKQKGICKKPSVYRDKICVKTCSRCSLCPKNTKIGFTIKYQSCLVADQRYGKQFKLGLLKHMLYHDCMMKCKSLSTCKSFDFYIGKKKGLGVCVLNKVNPKQLEMNLYPRLMKLGASYKDLQRNHAIKCILSIKQCKKKCTMSKVKKLDKCKCSKFKSQIYCYQKSLIYYYITGRSGRCLKRVWKGLVPCGHDSCNDLDSDRKCHLLKQKKKCGKKSVKRRCQKTCSKCVCSRVQSYTTKCDKSNHRFKVSVVTAKHRKHGKCVIDIIKEKRSCSVCYKKSFKVVHKCKHSVRSITSIRSIQLKEGLCKIVSNNNYYSCSKCPRQDQYFVTSCINGHLKLITKYSIREKGCCKFKLNSRQFFCSKCPQKQVRRTHCSEGQRLRHVYYYVRADIGTKDKKHKVNCIKRVYTKIEKCNTMRVCRDEMSAIDCKLFKKSGGCHQKEADAFRLCQATCGVC